MSETVHLYLNANGNAIQGESTQASMERADSIECVSFEHSVSTAREAGSGMATGRRQFTPIRILKRIDKATPLLLKALCNSEVIEAVFKFFRPNPAGDGTDEQFFTVEIKNGRVASERQYVPLTLHPETANDPPLEEVTFIFQNITWTYTAGGITHTDSWKGE
jgi:type VI secretion system secreted protein Hcp